MSNRTDPKKAYVQRQVNWYHGVLADTPCQECGSDLPWPMMDFTYLDESPRASTPLQLAQRGYSKKRITDEIAKGIIVCKSCAAAIDKLRQEIRDLRRTARERQAAVHAEVETQVRQKMGLEPHFADQLLKGER